MIIKIPRPSLIMLIGPSSCGKSTFAEKHFKKTEIISSDFCRALISDEEDNQAVSKNAFDLLHFIMRKRLYHGRVAVIDATNVRREVRKRLFFIAETYGAPVIGIAFNLSLATCLARNRRRRNRSVQAEVVIRQWKQMQQALRNLEKEEFARLYVFSSADEVAEARLKVSQIGEWWKT